MKIAMTIVGVIIVIILFGAALMPGINDARTDERTDAFAGVATGMGVTTADVVLVADVYGNDILNVTDITSDNILDAPLPDAYNPATDTLTVRGLNGNDTRGLSIVYEYDAMTGDSATAGTFLGFVPLFVGIAIIVIIIGVAVAAFASRR